MNWISLLGLFFLVGFCALIVFFTRSEHRRSSRILREIPAFSRIRRDIGLTVESGRRLHLTVGHGGLADFRGGSALVGLSFLERIARAASNSDRPPIATSGEALLTFLSQDTLQSVYRTLNAESQFDPAAVQLTGLTPFSYAAGVIPIVSDPLVSTNLFSGHFGSEIGLILDVAERKGSLTVGGSDDLQAQAVFFAAAQEPLVGEELYAGGAYLQVNPFHLGSVQAQDVMRWLIVSGILVGVVLKVFGFL